MQNTNKKEGRRRELKGGKMQKKYIYIKEVRKKKKDKERQKRENKRKDEAN